MSYEGTFEGGLDEDTFDREFVNPIYEGYEKAWNEFHETTTSLSTIVRVEHAYIWSDPVHGEPLLDDPVVCRLIEAPAFQRLWGVQQFGERWAVASLLRSRPHSRAEHSLGTYQLLRRGAPDDRHLQIAGLLHDVGHTAFSHHGEAAFDDDRQQVWHEQHLERILRDERYGIAAVLAQAEIDPAAILEKFDHPLLDQPMPELCADRIDYILRDLVASYPAYDAVCEDIIPQIKVRSDGEGWYVESPAAAHFLKKGLDLCNKGLYTNPMMRQIKHHTTDLLKLALEKGYLTESDIADGTDDQVLDALWNLDEIDPVLNRLLLRLREFGLARSTPEAIGYVMDYYAEFRDFDPTTKNRSINPYCMTTEGLRRVSEIYHPDEDLAYYPISDRRSVILPTPPR